MDHKDIDQDGTSGSQRMTIITETEVSHRPSPAILLIGGQTGHLGGRTVQIGGQKKDHLDQPPETLGPLPEQGQDLIRDPDQFLRTETSPERDQFHLTVISIGVHQLHQADPPAMEGTMIGIIRDLILDHPQGIGTLKT